MRIAHERPPNFEEISKAFPEVLTKRGVIFTYGEVMYNPDGMPIDEALAFHEAVHAEQQRKFGGADKWWREFIANGAFRRREELEAYRAQYRRFCELNKSRERQMIVLHRISLNFASEQYGSIITHAEAMKLIGEAKPLSTRKAAKPLKKR